MEGRIVWELDWELENQSFSEKNCKNNQESPCSQLEKCKVKCLLNHSKGKERNATINCHGYKKTPKFMLTKGNQLLKKTALSSQANFFSNHDTTSIWEASPKYETDGLIISDSSTKITAGWMWTCYYPFPSHPNQEAWWIFPRKVSEFWLLNYAAILFWFSWNGCMSELTKLSWKMTV